MTTVPMGPERHELARVLRKRPEGRCGQAGPGRGLQCGAHAAPVTRPGRGTLACATLLCSEHYPPNLTQLEEAAQWHARAYWLWRGRAPGGRDHYSALDLRRSPADLQRGFNGSSRGPKPREAARVGAPWVMNGPPLLMGVPLGPGGGQHAPPTRGQPPRGRVPREPSALSGCLCSFPS